MIKVLNLKLVILLEYQNTKRFLQKTKLKKLLKRFTKRNSKKKKNQSKLELKILQRVKAINYILKGKVMIVVLTVGLIKKT